jgi:HK97 gp10 family phage protein
MNEITVNIQGLDELEEALKTLPEKAARNIMRSSLKEAAGLWREEMVKTVRRGWHVWTAVTIGKKSAAIRERFEHVKEFGVVSRLIGMKTSISPDGLAGTCSVGPVKKAFWALFMEFGTGHEAPIPFVRPAFESRKDAVVQKFADSCREKLRDAGIL